MHETENWVAIGFLFFLGLLAYLGAHRKLIDALDQRQARIKSELDDARRLREEAQALLAEFERKGREAETEAAAIIASARAEAERLAAEAKARIRRFRRAPDQIGGTEDRPGRVSGAGRRTFRRGRGRSRRRREDSFCRRQGQGRGGPARSGHRRRQTKIQLSRAAVAAAITHELFAQSVRQFPNHACSRRSAGNFISVHNCTVAALRRFA